MSAGQSWDPFRPVEPLAPTPANLAAPQKPIEAQMGVMPGTYARQRPNQLVRAALGNSSLADGAHVKTCANTVAPLHVSSSLAVPALSGETLGTAFSKYPVLPVCSREDNISEHFCSLESRADATHSICHSPQCSVQSRARSFIIQATLKHTESEFQRGE